MYNRAVKNSKGFTLIELMVSIFVFSLVMTSATAVFAKVFRARQKSNAIQKNIEDTRYAMELMAKSLRMSSIISSTSPSQANGSILSYDYSQGKCIRYWTSNGFLYMSSKISDFSSCSTSGLSTNIMTTGRITGFRIRSITSDYTSGSKRAGWNSTPVLRRRT